MLTWIAFIELHATKSVLALDVQRAREQGEPCLSEGSTVLQLRATLDIGENKLCGAQLCNLFSPGGWELLCQARGTGNVSCVSELSLGICKRPPELA